MTNQNAKTSTLITPATLAARMARILNHGCTPENVEKKEFGTVAELLDAMWEASWAFNETCVNDCDRVQPWAGNHQGLVHVTVSRRMQISVTDTCFSVTLFSPSFGGGNAPYFTCKVEEGELTAWIEPGAEEVVKGLWRLSPIGWYIIPIVGEYLLQVLDVDPRTTVCIARDAEAYWMKRLKHTHLPEIRAENLLNLRLIQQWINHFTIPASPDVSSHDVEEAEWDRRLCGASH